MHSRKCDSQATHFYFCKVIFHMFLFEAYRGSQLIASRVILVHLKFIAILDRRVSLIYALLKSTVAMLIQT